MLCNSLNKDMPNLDFTPLQGESKFSNVALYTVYLSVPNCPEHIHINIIKLNA